MELVGDFRRAHAAVPLRFGLSGLNRIIQPNPLFVHEDHSRNAHVRIIRHMVGSSDQHRPSVHVKYVENCRKIGKIQNQFC